MRKTTKIKTTEDITVFGCGGWEGFKGKKEKKKHFVWIGLSFLLCLLLLLLLLILGWVKLKWFFHLHFTEIKRKKKIVIKMKKYSWITRGCWKILGPIKKKFAPRPHTFWQSIKGAWAKNLEATLLFIFAYGLPKETVTNRMMLYENVKVMVRST